MFSTNSQIWKWLRKGSVVVCVVGFLIGIAARKNPYPYENGAGIGWLLLIGGMIGYIIVKTRSWKETRVKTWSILSLMGGVISVFSIYKMLTLSYFRGGDIAAGTFLLGFLCYAIGQIGIRLNHRKKTQKH